MTKQRLSELECSEMLAKAKLQRAIDNGVKLFLQERQRDWRDRPLEVQFFGRPL